MKFVTLLVPVLLFQTTAFCQRMDGPVEGKLFNSQMMWNKIYKVSQTKRWLFIWQSKQRVNAIHKSDVRAGALTELKQILIAQGGEK